MSVYVGTVSSDTHRRVLLCHEIPRNVVMNWYPMLVASKLTGTDNMALWLSTGLLLGLKNRRVGSPYQLFRVWSPKGQSVDEIRKRLRCLTKPQFQQLLADSEL